jgi:predicted helicase
MQMHLDYERVKPYFLQREDRQAETLRQPLMPRLIAHREQGSIEIDTNTTLKGIPSEAWSYQLGTHSALEWLLDRYKERKPKDPTIREKFNTYRFADYKEEVIDLLQRICAVSLETMKIITEMPKTQNPS